MNAWLILRMSSRFCALSTLPSIFNKESQNVTYFKMFLFDCFAQRLKLPIGHPNVLQGDRLSVFFQLRFNHV